MGTPKDEYRKIQRVLTRPTFESYHSEDESPQAAAESTRKGWETFTDDGIEEVLWMGEALKSTQCMWVPGFAKQHTSLYGANSDKKRTPVTAVRMATTCSSLCS
ncbi:hypothetical protein KIN20_013493 [Parelaphostrongylus tenuis]|uniref:Uncharacterized protein n=1 Tax=Parelaphostrongylus tenuis TaxID=148309 RepID=A0AAD5QNV2_PARTN|nr:hypothetical protein KIN20_013493 [Parelaphostrongylus tenuis]